MGDKTAIEWADATWNPMVGCSKVSEGCDNCYAIGVAHRGMSEHHRGLTVRVDGDTEWNGEIHRAPDSVFYKPLAWKRPRRIFVNSLSDMFHPNMTDEMIADVLAVMKLAPHHTYQVLTKRSQRMAAYMSDPATPGRVALAADRIVVSREVAKMGDERRVEIAGYPGYCVTDRGRVLLSGGSETCLWCGTPLSADRIARSKFCKQACTSKVHYERSQGRWEDPVTFRELRPDAGHQGHLRVRMVGPDGVQHHELVHRLVLSAFDREPVAGEQGCHRDGDPGNNALPNLRWGTQGSNWEDRIRHGNGRSWSKLTPEDVESIRRMHKASEPPSVIAEQFGVSNTQVRNIVNGVQWATPAGGEWPLPCLWLGVSIESNKYVFRANHLRNTLAAVRWVSAEPLIGPLDELDLTDISWIVCGGESGPGARPMHPEWVRDLRDRCIETCDHMGHWIEGQVGEPGGHDGDDAGEPCDRPTAFFFKQHGSWVQDDTVGRTTSPTGPKVQLVFSSRAPSTTERGLYMRNVGKKAAGRMLDGRTWDEMPVVKS